MPVVEIISENTYLRGGKTKLRDIPLSCLVLDVIMATSPVGRIV